MTQHTQLANDLDALMKLSVRNKSGLTEWYESAKRVQTKIREDAYGIEVPHFILHYLIDADTRFKDSKYADGQQALVREYINQLRAAG